MLKPIHRVPCSPALAACQRLMRRFSLWLCDSDTTSGHISQQGLQPPVLASAIEADWLWEFLQRVDDGQSLLSRAQSVANMPTAQKANLASWICSVSALTAQFQPEPTPWPITRPIPEAAWRGFKVLMDAFYEKGFRSGLPFLADGTPTAARGITYKTYVEDFRNEHRFNPNADAHEVCVMCGDRLGDTPHVDHWITKSAFPLLSMCQDNLILMCGVCNEAPNKGEKPVHSAGNFKNWFHPYLRPGNGALQLSYELPKIAVRCNTESPADQPKADNLDALLNLTSRWTKEFKAKYFSHQDILIRRERRRIRREQARHTQGEIQSYIQQWQDDLNSGEPHYEVHHALGNALQEPNRLAAWFKELSFVS